MRATIVACAAGLALTGCAHGGKMMSAEQRAHCQQMKQQMGLGTSHDHSAMRGNPPNAMNMTHEQCQAMMAKEAAQ